LIFLFFRFAFRKLTPRSERRTTETLGGYLVACCVAPTCMLAWNVNFQEWASTPRGAKPDTSLHSSVMPRAKSARRPGGDMRVGSPSPKTPRTPRTARSASPARQRPRAWASPWSPPSDDGENLFGRQLPRLDVASKLWLMSQPVYEVAEGHTAVVSLSCGSDPPGRSTVARLPSGTRVFILATGDLPDGTRRACVVLEGAPSLQPLGWTTMVSSDRSSHYVYQYARPVYRVVESPRVRTAFELSSRLFTSLSIGTRVHVVDSRRSADGSLRVCVRLLGEEEPLGWITAKKSNGMKLIVEERADKPGGSMESRQGHLGQAAPREGDSTREGRDGPSSADIRRGKSYARPSSSGSNSSSACAVEKAAAADRAAAADGAATAGGATTTAAAAAKPAAGGGSGGGGLKGLMKLKGLLKTAAAAGAAAPPPTSFGAVVKAAVSASKAAKAKEEALMSAQELCVLADGFERDAASREEQAAGVHSSFERRLGLAILAKIGKGGKLADMVKNEWDKNGDGDINKLEFRQCVRGSLSMKADGKEIDAFFASMDVDGGGSLDLSELQPMLKKLQQGAANADQEAADQRREAVALRAKAASVREVAAATSAHEQADARLRQLQQVENVGAKLGAMIVKRNMKLGEVVQKWDKDGDGTVDKREFRENVLAMGVVAKAEAIDALFDTYDSDGGGSLDMRRRSSSRRSSRRRPSSCARPPGPLRRR
jgi:Ca2+-binding EF-hand superfamily protein